MSDLVSIIIPAYNHEKFIQRTLISVYNQSYSNVELIIVDDFSKDKTYETVDNLCKTSQFKNRFKSIILKKNKENLGAHATINEGISLSSGNLISILNSDDLYHPNRIEKLVDKFKEAGNPYFFGFSNYCFIDEYGETSDDHPLFIQLQYTLKNTIYELPHPWFIFLQMNIALSTGNFFFSKGLYEIIGGFLNLRYCHDLDFILQTLRYADPVFIDEPLYYYRVHSANTFSSVYNLRFVETEIALTRYFKTVEFEQVSNPNTPCRKNYPLLFEFYIKKFNLELYFKRALSGGYLPVHRVIDKELFKRLSYEEE